MADTRSSRPAPVLPPVPSMAPLVGDSSPWGRILTVHPVGRGMVFVSTASHGGLWLDDDARAIVLGRFGASPFLGTSEWWEEDCDTSLAMLILWDRLNAEHLRALILFGVVESIQRSFGRGDFSPKQSAGIAAAIRQVTGRPENGGQ